MLNKTLSNPLLCLLSSTFDRLRAIQSRQRFRKEFYSKYCTYITPENPFDLSILRRVERYSYGVLNVIGYGGYGEVLEIGEFVSIASGVVFHIGGEHALDRLSTFPFDVITAGLPDNAIINSENINNRAKGPVIIHDDVWIGTRALILSGVEICRGAVIGAGSVVASSIPPYAIAVGNPARVVKYRFTPDIIDILCKRLKYERITAEKISKIRPMLTLPLTRELLEDMLVILEL